MNHVNGVSAKLTRAKAILFKGCPHYKMITSQNVSCEAQIKNFFILLKSYVLLPKYSSFCIFNSHDLPNCDIMINIST